MKKLLLLTFSLLMMGFGEILAQKAEWGVGVRFGEPTGINVRKYFGGGSNALDITFGYNGYGYNEGRDYWKGEYRRSAVLMVNYLWMKPISGADGLEIYFGLGGQIGSRRYWDRDIDREESTLSLGASGVIGVEYFIPSTPISAFLDLGPYLELTPNPGWLWLDAGAGIRVNF